MQTEINPLDHYKKDVIMFLCKFSRSNKDKPFEEKIRQDVIAFLDRLRITDTDKGQSDTLRSKQCPDCKEPNRPDSKFAKCRMVLN
jgi:hypothetical protein